MLKRALLLLAIPVFVLFLAAPQAECRSPGHLFEVYTGKASFYSDKFHGRKTANGERYNKKALTAAHRFLPLGTVVRVTNLSNGRHLLVRINDRGPIKKSWILDVSREAASRLNMIRRGIAPVQVEVVADKRGHPVQRGTAFFLKVGEVKNQREGEARVVALRKQARHAVLHTGKRRASQVSARLFTETTLYGETRSFVGLGPFFRYSDALKVCGKLGNSYPRADVVCIPTAVAMHD